MAENQKLNKWVILVWIFRCLIYWLKFINLSKLQPDFSPNLVVIFSWNRFQCALIKPICISFKWLDWEWVWPIYPGIVLSIIVDTHPEVPGVVVTFTHVRSTCEPTKTPNYTEIGHHIELSDACSNSILNYNMRKSFWKSSYINFLMYFIGTYRFPFYYFSKNYL